MRQEKTTDLALKTGWRVCHFDQMATNVYGRIDDLCESAAQRDVGPQHLDADLLKLREFGMLNDVEADGLMFKKDDIIFGRRRAYRRRRGSAECGGVGAVSGVKLRTNHIGKCGNRSRRVPIGRESAARRAMRSMRSIDDTL
jgi:hypothetical protein